MSKRFTDTEKWKRQWFRELPPVLKSFWCFILDNCDAAGVWMVDIPRAAFEINDDLPAQEVILAAFGGRIIPVTENIWWVRDFIEFQYGCVVGALNESSKVHTGIIRILAKHRITKDTAKGYITLTEGFANPPGVGVGVGVGVRDNALSISLNSDDARAQEGNGQEKPPSGKTFPADSEPMLLANLLWRHIQSRRPECKPPNLQRWAGVIDLMVRVDNRPPAEIKRVIEWCQADAVPRNGGFCWANNILSPAKLRQHYDTLMLRMAEGKPRPAEKKTYVLELPDGRTEEVVI